VKWLSFKEQRKNVLSNIEICKTRFVKFLNGFNGNIIAINSIVAIVFAWLSLDAIIARGYGSTRVMLSSIPLVHSVQRQYGLHVQGIMVGITLNKRS
jgi:hypothetical protein